jgi:hypothetical protein
MLESNNQIPTIKFPNEDHIHTTIIGAILNALNLITGTSFVGIPFALKQSGLVVGLVILGALCYFTGKGCLTICYNTCFFSLSYA